MADGSCSGEQVDDVVTTTKVLLFENDVKKKNNNNNRVMAVDAEEEECAADVLINSTFYCSSVSASDKFLDKFDKRGNNRDDDDDDDDLITLTKEQTDEIDEDGGGGGGRGGFLTAVVPEDDCRKKRCVDRYDSSESSDSGVAVLSCTDCSGSSTASSDITDPGSPFSTASNHSEDSGSQSSTKMPPTQQTAHHPPWPWTTETSDSIHHTQAAIINKRSMQFEKTAAFPKRLKSNEDTIINASKQSPTCLKANIATATNNTALVLSDTNPSPNDVSTKLNIHHKKTSTLSKKADLTKQGKITEYFKSQVKVHVIKKELVSKTTPINGNAKFVSLVDQQTQFNGISSRPSANSRPTATKKSELSKSSRKASLHHHITVPRKILPAPSKVSENQVTVNHQVNFAPAMTLTAVSFPPNLTYLHTKAPKPPDNHSIFVPQFATITNNTSTIPIINRTPCLNVISNFNCVKLNATVVPIVKLNTLAAAPRTSSLSVETAQPTVISAKPKGAHESLIVSNAVNTIPSAVAAVVTPRTTSIDEVRRSIAVEESLPSRGSSIIDDDDDKSPSPVESSDSGISSLKDGGLEVEIGLEATTPSQKSPILSQPKTIRFPPVARQDTKDDVKEKTTHAQESGLCRWAECNAQFDTSGALLEHLQLKHVISQATQEQYVCLWLGCKVHGRTSCSRSWLERHVLAHAGTKPFRCIVDGCGQRFNSQLTLERHVNGHFNGDGSQNGSAKKSTDNSSVKLFKRNGKKIRFRRQPWSARMFDFIDAGIMEGLQHKLLTVTQERTMGHIHEAGNAINLLSQVIARRVEPDGKVKFLVKWDPVGIIPDEWVTEKEFVPMKSVNIQSLHPTAKDVLSSRFFPFERRKQQERRRKHIAKKQPT